MKAADLRNRDNSTAVGRFDFSFYRSVAFKGKMCSRLVIIAEVRPENSSEMSLVENDEMIQTLAPDRANQSLDVVWYLYLAQPESSMFR